MASGFEFELDDAAVPRKRSEGLLRLPVADDGPPGTMDVFLASFSSSDAASNSSVKTLKERDSSALPEDDQKQTGSTAKSSVLGSELAKKRLQAFCIQKKQSGSCNSPTSVLKQTANAVLPSNLLIGNKFQGSLKKTPCISRTNPLAECAEKAKNLPKKVYKKVTEYEKSRTTLTEILELKKEEDRKLALIKLGVPLGLVPANVSVKGLTPKPMPTKAMPPVHNFLDAQQIESLLKKADMLVTSNNLNFEIPLKNESIHPNKQKSSKNQSHSRDSRSSNTRRSENYRRDDYRHDRNDRNRSSRRKHDSHSSSKHRDSSSSHSWHKSRDKDKHSSSNKGKKSSKNDNDQNNKVDNNKSNVEIDNNKLNTETYDNTNEIKKKPVESKQTEILVAHEKNISNFDQFSIESLHENSHEMKYDIETDIKEKSQDVEVNKESKIIYDKFLKEKFVPFPSIDDRPSDEKKTSPSFNHSPNINLADVLKCQYKNSNKIDLYSPEIELSRASSLANKNSIYVEIPLIKPPYESPLKSFDSPIKPHESPITPSHESSMKPSQESTVKSFLEYDQTKIEKLEISKNHLLEVEKACRPNKHHSSNCLRKTSSYPQLTYCENFNSCNCNMMRLESVQKLAEIGKISLSSMKSESQSYIEDSGRQWYPRSDKSLLEFVKFSSDIASNWDTDDSLSQPPQNTKQAKKYNMIESESDQIVDSELNFKNLSIFKNDTSFESTPRVTTVDLNSTNNDGCDLENTKECVPPVSSLDSEYEKFMEAVWPQIGDDGNNSYRSSTHSTSQDEIAQSPKNMKLSAFDLSISQDMFENKENISQQEMSEKGSLKNEIAPLFSIEKHDTVAVTEVLVPKKTDFANGKSFNALYLNMEEECWNSDNSDDLNISKLPSSKSSPKRKGHAKISSRRKKGKSKDLHKNRLHSSSSSSSSNSDSSSESKSKSSSDSSSSSSTNSGSSDDDTSSQSSSNSSSKSGSDSNVDLSDSSDSSDSSAEKILKSLKKHKNKKLTKKLYAKAKKIVKKMENKRKMKKMKDLIAQEKRELVVSKEIVDEFSLKDDNDININDHGLQIDNSEVSKKHKLKMKKSKVKHKKRKISLEEESCSSSSDYEEFANVESKTKRVRDTSEDSQELVPDLKKKKTISVTENVKDMFDMDTLLNIKNEKISDDENYPNKSKIKELESKSKSPYKQEIINADELQNSFLEVNKIDETIIKTKLSNHSVKTIKNTVQDIKSQLYDDIIKSNNDNLSTTICENDKMNSNESAIKSVNVNPVNDQNADINIIHQISCITGNNSQIIDESNLDYDRDIIPIERIESDRHPNQATKPYRERKRTRWDSGNDVESVPQVNNSALIQVPIQEFESVNPEIHSNDNTTIQLYNGAKDPSLDDDENKIYKIPTISSRNIVSPEIFTDANDYEDYEVFDTEKTEDSLIDCVEYEGTKSPLRKISLDDRINMALQFQADEISSRVINDKSPEKGILIVGGSRVIRADPRITRTKKVSFADGFVPGQDSDCENELQNTKMTQSSTNSLVEKKKKKRSFSGHAYPCPETWPDYHSHWDRLPPPPPPPGSPPPELCDRTNFSLLNLNITASPLSRISRLPNAVAS